MTEGQKGRVQIFSSGGGTQSAAITALIVQGRLPKPDFVCIVDTERERGTTWQYLDAVIRPALGSVGLEVHRIRRSEWGNMPDHGKDWRSHNDQTLLIPAFTTQTGEVGKLSGFCSDKWKTRVRDRYVSKVLGLTRSRVCNWIGFSLDETRRAARMMAGEEFQSGGIRFPLIHDVPMRREQAIRLVESMGWPTPPRSACWMCPNQGDAEWMSLSPQEFAQAVEFDRQLRQDDPFAFLHSSGSPLSEAGFKSEENKDGGLFCSSEGCFT